MKPRSGGRNGPSALTARWDGKAWRKRALPKVALPKGMAGYGPVRMTTTAVHAFGPRNVWVTAGFWQYEFQVPGTVLLHVQNGRLVHRRTVPADPGRAARVLDLERIPGTTSLWGAAYQSKPDTSSYTD